MQTVDKDAEQVEQVELVGMQNGTATSKNSLAVSYKAVHSPYDPAIPP